MVIVLKVSFSFPAFKSILLILVNSIGQPPQPQWQETLGEAEEVRARALRPPASARVGLALPVGAQMRSLLSEADITQQQGTS